MTGTQWDGGGAGSAGDYFSQERAMIADQVRSGNISGDEAANMGRVLARIQGAVSDDTASTWHPGQFRKRFPNDSLAPALARAALAATTIGIPVEAFDTAALPDQRTRHQQRQTQWLGRGRGRVHPRDRHVANRSVRPKQADDATANTGHRRRLGTQACRRARDPVGRRPPTCRQDDLARARPHNPLT